MSARANGSGYDRATSSEQADLGELVTRIEALLPWASRETGQPVGMWVEDAGFVDTPHDPFPLGTPYVNICAASWEAAAAVWNTLRPIARIDDVRWLAGWRRRGPDAKMIRIYPDFDLLDDD